MRPQPRSTARGAASVALLLIDVINDLEFPEAEQLLRYARPMARKIARLRERCQQRSIPTIYVNDNFGRWRSDFRAVVEHCQAEESRGRQIAQLLRPEEDDYFVLKPMHSGFHSTTLEVLLNHLQIDTLILTGVAGDICVLFTANDAYMRGYRLIVPSDCVASNTPEANRLALRQMSRLLKAETSDSSALQLPAKRRPREPGLQKG